MLQRSPIELIIFHSNHIKNTKKSLNTSNNSSDSKVNISSNEQHYENECTNHQLAEFYHLDAV